jgi:hypothetical protein
MALKKIPVTITDGALKQGVTVWGYPCRILDDATNFVAVPQNLIVGGARGYSITHISTGARAGFGQKLKDAVKHTSDNLHRYAKQGETPDQCAIRMFKAALTLQKKKERANASPNPGPA